MRMSITIKLRPNYTCSCCGIVQEGDTTYTSLPLSSMVEAEKWLNQPFPAQGMPVGWVANGTYNYRCGNCE
jgi:hypothetical protein